MAMAMAANYIEIEDEEGGAFSFYDLITKESIELHGRRLEGLDVVEAVGARLMLEERYDKLEEALR
jgi:hypothetical protein